MSLFQEDFGCDSKQRSTNRSIRSSGMMQEKTLSKDEEYGSSPDRASPTRSKSLQEHPSLPLSSSASSPSHTPSKETYVANQPNIPRAIETSENPRDVEDDVPARPGIPTAISRRLYISHFLSMWNSRAFEFGAVLFLASIFPRTLLPLSIYALVRSAAAIVVGPLLGHAIDSRNRLQMVRLSIGKLFSSGVENSTAGYMAARRHADLIVPVGD